MACMVDPRASNAAFATSVFHGVRAFQTITDAWAKWGAASRVTEWPSIRIEFLEPTVATKRTPGGMHPKTYLQMLPELKGFSIDNAEAKYLSRSGDWISVSSEADWLAFFQFLLDDHAGAHSALQLKLPKLTPMQQSLWDRGAKLAKEASEKIRSFGKSLLSNAKVETTEIDKVEQFLKTQGFSEFKSNQLLYEELGYEKSDWPDLVDNLVEQGIPGVWGNTLKLSAKAKRGSIKSLATSSFNAGVRTMWFMKFQVLPDGDGGVDGLFAIYQLNATAPKEDTTGLQVEQSFKQFVELDAHRKWKKEVAQLMPETDGKRPVQEL